MSEYDRGPRGGGEYPYGHGQGYYQQPYDQQPQAQYYDQARDQWGRPYSPQSPHTEPIYSQEGAPYGGYGQEGAPHGYAYPPPPAYQPPRKRHPIRALT